MEVRYGLRQQSARLRKEVAPKAGLGLLPEAFAAVALCLVDIGLHLHAWTAARVVASRSLTSPSGIELGGS